MTLNIYDEELSASFRKSDLKPDKQYVFLSTILHIMKDVEGKIVLDLGCGDGYFTKALARYGAKKVIGVDNSENQLRLANLESHEDNIIYQYGDVFKDKLPESEIILSPFVVNYAESIADLKFLFKNVFDSLAFGGKAVFVVDLPKGKDLKKFGSVKTLMGDPVDGTKIKIELFNNEELICTLFSKYYTPQTLERTLTQVGFKNIQWHKPIISKEGVEKFGKEFWKDFLEETELGYVSAEKI